MTDVFEDAAEFDTTIDMFDGDALILWHPEQLSLHHLQHIRFQVDQDEEQTIFGGGQRTIGVGRVPTSASWFAIQAPLFHPFLKRFLKGRHQLGKLLHRQTGHIQKLQFSAMPTSSRLMVSFPTP